MKNITLTIDGRTVSVPKGTTILQAARENGIGIPTLCAYEGMGPHAACRLCMVTVTGKEKEQLSCAVKAEEGMEVFTDTPELFEKRKAVLTEMFRQHTVDCHHCARTGGSRIEDLDPKICENCFFCDCVREGFCQLQEMARKFGISELPFEIRPADFPVDTSTEVLVRDGNKCIRCRRCMDVCRNTQLVGILDMVKTENGSTVGVSGGGSLAGSECIRCGRCVDVCPTGGVYLAEHKDQMPYYAHLRGVKTAALVDESVLPELTRLFGAPTGSIRIGHLVSALKKIGIDEVYDAEPVRRITAAETAKALSRRRRRSPALVACDPAAKAWLNAKMPEKKADFVFMETAQLRFAALTKGRFDRVFRISGRNSLAAEVKDTGCADWFYNSRELYRILRRTGADPTRLKETPADTLEVTAEATEYDPVLGPAEWTAGGTARLLTLEVRGKKIPAAVCENPAQYQALAKEKAEVSVIRINA